MTLAEVVPSASDVITDSQRADYEANGYLCLPGFVGSDWLDELRSVTADFVEASRAETASGKVFDLEPTHTAEAPRLRRLISPVDQHPTYARFTFEGPPAQLAAALLGGPVRYHHSKLNFKWSDGGEEVKWHQDIQFWPHTDFTPLTIGVYLEDVDDDMSPMGVLPGSHLGQLYDLYASDGAWAGAMGDADIAGLDLEKMVYLDGPAGSVTVHNCCMVHGSLPNHSPRPRPLLLQTYSAIESYPIGHIGANGVTGANGGRICGGEASQRLTIGGRTMHGAPDWSRKGPPTIFGSQQNDDTGG
ncbi:phytanoyl-CoA dioxygenase family protein [Candidatus Poriferisodalis sp.]|uniref:phytanoyl-CoA dioxygenase family protein n=1 Tax=Candidatus Poriferisodalis sp. TaxID=3101277 RepID=UPI003B024DEB